MLKIGQFSKLTQVSVRMLRYYDENDLLKPALVDTFTGYRYYRPAQIQPLRRIIFLRNLGFGVAEIGAALQDWCDAAVGRLLTAKAREIEAEIESKRASVERIQAALTDIDQQQAALNYNIVIRPEAGFQALCLRKAIPSHWHESLLWEELVDYMKRDKSVRSQRDNRALAVYRDVVHADNWVDVEVCVQVPRMDKADSPFNYRMLTDQPYIAAMMVYGAYENLAVAFKDFSEWVERHPYYEMTGETRQICHRGPGNENDSANYVTEIQIVLSKPPKKA